MYKINFFNQKLQYKSQNLFFIFLCIALGLYLFSSHANAEYAEDACRNFDGNALCMPPLSPEVQGNWTYYLTAGEWGTIYGTGSTAQEAANAWDLTAGPPPPLDCTTCNILGLGYEVGPILGTTPSSIYSSARDIYSFANFEGYLPHTQNIPVKNSTGWLGNASVSGTRNVIGFRCPATTTMVWAYDPNRVRYPFMCKLPPEPKRCPTTNNNNPIKQTCCNPIDYVSGNKIQKENDWSAANGPLTVSRIYNSLPENPYISGTTTAVFGSWEFNYNKRITLQFNTLNGGDLAQTYEGSAKKLFTFSAQDYNWQYRPTPFYPVIRIKRPGANTQIGYFDQATTGTNGTFSKVTFKLDHKGSGISVDAFPDGSWLYRDKISGISEAYNQNGQLARINYRNGQYVTLSYNATTLLQVTDNFGRALKFAYDSSGQLQSIELPNHQLMTYGYDTQNRLVSVTRPGYGTKTYQYSENNSLAPSGNPHLLTGITDEKGVRFATYTYDSSDRAISTEHAGGAEKYSINYGNSGQRVVTDAHGRLITYSLQNVQGYDTPNSVDDNI